jgi:hypothetical protein
MSRPDGSAGGGAGAGGGGCPAVVATDKDAAAAADANAGTAAAAAAVAAAAERPPLLPFGEWVAQRWHCSREADAVEYDKAVALAETSLFGQPDEVELEEEEERHRHDQLRDGSGGAGGGGGGRSSSSGCCIPLGGSVPKLGECASLSSVSVKDDRNPECAPKPPLLDHLEDLAAEYFGAWRGVACMIGWYVGVGAN